MIFFRLITNKLQRTIISSDLNNPKLRKAVTPPKTITNMSNTNKSGSSLGAKAGLGSAPLESASSFFGIIKYVRLLEESYSPKPSARPNVLALYELGALNLCGFASYVPHPPAKRITLISARDLEAADKLFLRLERVLSLPENRLKNLNTDDYFWSTLSIAENLSLGKQKRWLTKNSILTNSLVQEVYKLTESKKLLGLNLNMSDISTRNIFFSSKNGSMTKSELLNQLVTFNNSLFRSFTGLNTQNHTLPALLLSPGIKTLDSGETSTFFTYKKYYLNNTLICGNSTSDLSSKAAYDAGATLSTGSELANTAASILVTVSQRPMIPNFVEISSLPDTVGLLFFGSDRKNHRFLYGGREYIVDASQNSLLKGLDLKLVYLITSDIAGANFTVNTSFNALDFFGDTYVNDTAENTK